MIAVRSTGFYYCRIAGLLFLATGAAKVWFAFTGSGAELDNYDAVLRVLSRRELFLLFGLCEVAASVAVLGYLKHSLVFRVNYALLLSLLILSYRVLKHSVLGDTTACECFGNIVPPGRVNSAVSVLLLFALVSFIVVGILSNLCRRSFLNVPSSTKR